MLSGFLGLILAWGVVSILANMTEWVNKADLTDEAVALMAFLLFVVICAIVSYEICGSIFHCL